MHTFTTVGTLLPGPAAPQTDPRRPSRSSAFQAITLLSALLFTGGATGQSEHAATAPAKFTSDGCSLFPDRSRVGRGDWCHCCLAHDLAYWRGGTAEERVKADQELQACVQAATGSAAQGELMLAGVRLGGGPYFKTPYRWGYGWPYGRGYLPLSEAEQAAAARLEGEYRLANPQLTCTDNR